MAALRSASRKLPRVVYWTLGAVIACGGAATARLVGDNIHPDYRYLAWLAGSVLIFVGVAVLSLGTNARLHPEKAAKDAWIALVSVGGWSG